MPQSYFMEFARGIKAGSPIAIGYIPIALAFGALALEAGLLPIEAVLMSLLVYAGASQFMAATMVLSQASVIQIVAATFFINLRHLIMSMAVNNKFKDFPTPWKTVLAFGITDETFALITMQDDTSAEQRPITPFFSAGLMGIVYLAWVGGTALGGVSAKVIPATISASMTVGLYAMFIGLLVPHVRKSFRIGAIAILSMLLNSLFNTFLAAGWAIVLATILGATLGIYVMEEETA